MYNFCIEGISYAKNKIIATRVPTQSYKEYQFRRLDYSNVYIPNRTTACGLSLQSEESEEKSKLRHNVINYNSYLDFLDGIKGFKSYFVKHNFCVSKEEVENNWSMEIADKVFALESYIFSTDLEVFNNYLIDKSITTLYSAIVDGSELLLTIGKNEIDYPSEINKKKIIWNYVNNGHDFCCEMWFLIEDYCENKEAEYNEDAVGYSFNDFYDQFRDEDPEIQLVRIFKKLENLGYVNTFTIVPEKSDPEERPSWKYYCKSDGSLDCAIVDMSFLKNRLVMEQINLILWSTPEVLKDNPYILTNEKNKQYLSAVSGKICGHKKLKIYGRLGCPSAQKHLSKGQYAKNRVFFLDEKTAVKAGYRPCAICMLEEYKNWKTTHNK